MKKANAQNNKGDTPLHIAASKSSRELVRLLLDKQARDDIKNNEGKVPHELAKNQEIIDILKNRDFYSSDYDDISSQASLNEGLINIIRNSVSETEKLEEIESLLQSIH